MPEIRTRALWLLLAFLLAPSASAELRVYWTASGSHPVVYDDVAGLAWMRDMSETSSMDYKDYADQLSLIAGMNTLGSSYHGLMGWHMATEAELEDLLENKLSDIAPVFDLHCFGNTCVASGRYENSVNPPVAGYHHTFNVTRLTCCEPYDMSTSGYGVFPYTELLVNPGTGNDILFFAAPVPSIGHTPAIPDDTNAIGQAAWVATDKVKLSADGSLASTMFCREFLGRTLCYTIAQVVLTIAAILAAAAVVSFATWKWWWQQ